MPYLRLLTVAALLPTLLQGTALAQNARLPGVVDRDLLTPDMQEERLSAPDAMAPSPALPAVVGSDAAITPLIRRIEMEGATLLPAPQLRDITEKFTDRSLSEKDVQQLKYALTEAYFERGYILVKVVTPPQEMKDGVLRLKVVEGRIDAVHFDNETLYAPVAEGLFSRVQPGDYFQEETVESALNDIDGLRNVQTELRLEPGEAFGTSALNLHINEADEDVQTLEVSNYGSHLVSRELISLSLQKSNLLDLGEQIDARFTYGPSELRGMRLGWVSPIPHTDWFFNTSYAFNDLDIVGRFRALGSTGESQSIRAGVSRNFLNTSIRKLTALLGVEYRRHESFLSNVPETDDTIAKLRATVSYLHRWSDSLLYAGMEVLRGVTALGATQQGDAMATRAHDPHAWIVSPNLLLRHRLTEKDQVTVKFGAQYATGTLLSSDLFSIGGYDSVRGFEPGQETGEAGINASLEYRRDVYNGGTLDVALRPFVDAGMVSNRLSGASLDSHLYSAGVGMDMDVDHGAAGSAPLRVSLDAATSLGNYRSGLQQDAYLYFRLRQSF